MRKHIAFVMAAAMTVSLCGVIPSKESRAEKGTKIAPSFTAYLVQNNSHIFTTTKSVVRRGTELVEVDDQYQLGAYEEWEVMECVSHTEEITSTGIYSIEAVAEDDANDLLEEASYIAVNFGSLGKTDVDGTDNYILPTSYHIQPKTIDITSEDGTKIRTLDWSKGKVYNNGNTTEGNLRIGVVNQYVSMGSKHEKEYQLANPFLTNRNGEWVDDLEPVEVSKGDKLTFTFEVTTGDSAATMKPDKTPSSTVMPTGTPRSSSSRPKATATPRSGKGNTISKTKPIIAVKGGKTKEGISYIKIRLKKYTGTNVAIYYRTKRKKWKKIRVTSSSIKKNHKVFRIRCSSRRQKYYFRVRTYRRQNGKNKYS